MFELSKILAPIDTSSTSQAAYGLASHLAEVYGAKLHSTHIVPTMPPQIHRVLFPYAALGEDVGDFEAELLEAARRDFRRRFGAKDNGSPHPDSVAYGNVVDGLLQVILSFGPDLVVVGAHGESGVRPRHLGSNTARLLDSWVGPVLVARETHSIHPLGRLVVATDFSTGSESLLHVACGLAIRTQNPLSVVTVVDDPRLHDRGGLLRGALRVDAKALVARARRNARQHFKRMASGLAIPFPDQEPFQALNPKLTVLYGDPAEMLREFIGEYDDVLIVVGRSQRGEGDSSGIGRTAESIVRRVPAHVLVTPV